MPPIAADGRAYEIRRNRLQPVGAACFIFLAASLTLTWLGRGERSGWILITSPVQALHRTNTLLGYCYLHGGAPFMKENIPHAAQVGVFCGSRKALTQSEFRQDFRFLRGLYSVIAAIPAPLIGTIPAMLLVNWLSWAICAWVAWRLAHELFHMESAALLAVALVAGGMGLTIHIGDYSPHLLGFAGYYFGVWLLFRSGVHCQSRSWRAHLRLSLYFAVVSLAYNTGVMLAAVYLLVSVRKNSLLHLIAASFIALTARPLWRAILGARVVDVEAEYLERALSLWRDLLERDLPTIVATVGHWISEFVFFFDSPLVVLAGLGCCLTATLSGSARWLGFAVVIVPFLAAIPFAPAASARGYLVYSGSLWLYVCLAGQIAQSINSHRGAGRVLIVATAALLLVSHFTWSTAHLAGFLGPAKTYFLGWDQGFDVLFSLPTVVSSLTDAEPTPVLFGGNASLIAAGAHLAPTQRIFTSNEISLPLALIARAWFFAYFGALTLAVTVTARHRVFCVGAVIVLYVLSCLMAAGFFRSSPAFFPVDRAVPLHPGQTLRCDIGLGRQFLGSLQRHVAANDALVVFVSGEPFFDPDQQNAARFSFEAGGEPLPVKEESPGMFTMRGETLRQGLEMLSQARELTVKVSNIGDRPTRLAGWQRNDLPRRRCGYGENGAHGGEKPQVLPVVELRLLRPNGRIKVAGF